MSTPAHMRRYGPEYKHVKADDAADDAEGFADAELAAWCVDALVELDGETEARKRFGLKYDRVVAHAALHLFTQSRKGLNDTRRGNQGMGMSGELTSVGTGNTTFSTSSLIRGASLEYRATWGGTRFGDYVIGELVRTEATEDEGVPQYISPSY